MRKLVQFEVMGYEACPWSVPFIGRNGGSFQAKKSRPYAGILNLPDWQGVVRDAAIEAMAKAGVKITLGPTKVHIEFFTVTPPGRRHGELWTADVKWNPKANKGKGGWVKAGKSRPDILNLFKGTEDALENVSFGNDVQNSIISSSRWFGPLPGVRVTVFEIQPGDFPGVGDPVPIEANDAQNKPRSRKRK